MKTPILFLDLPTRTTAFVSFLSSFRNNRSIWAYKATIELKYQRTQYPRFGDLRSYWTIYSSATPRIGSERVNAEDARRERFWLAFDMPSRIKILYLFIRGMKLIWVTVTITTESYRASSTLVLISVSSI